MAGNEENNKMGFLDWGPLTSPTTLIASMMAEDFSSRSFSQFLAAPQIETPQSQEQNLKPLSPAGFNGSNSSSRTGKENDPFSISGGFAAGSVPTSGFGQVHKPPSRTGGGSFAERLAARGGFNAPRLNTARLKSSYLTIPPGLSSTTLLDSPVLLSNSQAAQSPTTGSFPLPPFLHESSPLNSGSDGLKDNSYEDGTSSSFPLTSPTTLIAVASTMAEDFGSRSFSQLFAAPQIETPQNLKPLSPAGFNGSNSSQSYVLTKGWSRFSKKRSMEFRLLHCVAYGESWYEIGGSCAVEHVPDKIAVVSIGVVHGGVGLVGIAHGGPTGLCHDHRDVCEVQRGHGVVGRVDHGIEDVGIVEQCVGVNGLLVGQEQSEQSVVQRHHTVALHVDTEGLSRSVVAQNRSRAIEEKDGIDYAAVTVQLPGDERVPFLFTVKQLVASGTPESFSGQFLMPAYRGFSFLDPKGRGGSTGYDNAVALPAGGRGDEDELAKENIKVVSVSKGGITLSVSKSKPETHMVIGVFDSLQPSDTDLGSTAPKDVKIQGIWYAQIGKALALLALGSAITVTPYKIVPG